MRMAVAEGLEEARRSEGSSATPQGFVRHGTSMAVWNVPAPIEVGANFSPRIGVRCDDGCVLSGAAIEVLDDGGKRVATGTLGPISWAGTADLYWVQVEVRAPTDEGYHQWSARFPDGQGVEFQHEESGQPFAFSTVRPPQHSVTVGVTDAATGRPVDNAYVRLGLYTSYTDDAGTARVSVPNGDYTFVVWKRKHDMYRTTIEVTDDQDLKVQLLQCKICNGASGE